ncbi:MAG: EamA family transporter, partial [Deltaproteobacteria bacterium]|nr:EamA family transporter [Deltaproteobacteria bacterium]
MTESLDSPRARVVGTFQVAFAASCWGCWSLFLRPSGLSVWVTMPIVLAVVALATWPFVRTDRETPRWDRTTVAMLVVYALLDLVNVGTFFGAMGETSVAVAVLTHYATPLLVALAAPWVDGERVPGAPVAAIVGFVGLVLVLAPWEVPDAGAHGSTLVGGALGLASAFAYAGNVFLCRRVALRLGPARAMSYHAMIAAVLAAPALFVVSWRVEAQPMAYVLAGGVLAGAIPGLLFVRGIRATGATRAAILAFLEPTVAVAVGWLAWGESLSWAAGLGAALVLGAGLWVSRPRGLPAPEGAAIS